jgi:hypothetical protein
MLRKVFVFFLLLCLFLGSRVVSADLRLDHFPLDQGARWTYSVLPSTVSGDFQGYWVEVSFGDLTVSIPSEGQRHAEMPFTGTVLVYGIPYSLSGNWSYDEGYNLGSSSTQLVSEDFYFNMRVPSVSVRMTLDGSGTYAPPPTIVERGIPIGGSIPSSATFSGSLTMTYKDPYGKDTQTLPVNSSVDTTVGVIAQEQITSLGQQLDTLKMQIDVTIDGEASQKTMNLARFIGPVKMVQPIPGIEELFGSASDVTCTLLSTNLPVWEPINSFLVDSSILETLNFDVDVNGVTRTVQIEIPATCLSGDCEIMVADIINIPPSTGINGISWAVGVNIEEPNITVNCPITVTIPYTQADLDSAGITDPNALKVYRWSSPSSGWVALQITNVDTTNETISFEVSEFSLFGNGAPAPIDYGGGGGGGCLISTVAHGFRGAERAMAMTLFVALVALCIAGFRRKFSGR